MFSVHNDILVYSISREDFDRHLKIGLQIFKEKQLYSKFNKYNFWLNKIIFLKYVGSGKGIKVDPHSIKVLD